MKQKVLFVFNGLYYDSLIRTGDYYNLSQTIMDSLDKTRERYNSIELPSCSSFLYMRKFNIDNIIINKPDLSDERYQKFKSIAKKLYNRNVLQDLVFLIDYVQLRINYMKNGKEINYIINFPVLHGEC